MANKLDPDRHFISGRSDDELYRFASELSQAAREHVQFSDGYEVKIEWVAGSERPMATLFVEPKLIGMLTQAITSLELNGGPKTPSSCGTGRKEPRSLRAC